MRENTKNTIEAILAAGQIEFLKYGYEKASLRRIAREANVTTGAIYVHFSGKEALFDALTKEVTDRFLQIYRKEYEDFNYLPLAEQFPLAKPRFDDAVPMFINYLYDHFTVFKLFLCCNQADRGEQYIAALSAVGEQAVHLVMAKIEAAGCPKVNLDRDMIHILTSSLLQQVKGFIVLDIPRERALEYTKIMNSFWRAGWMKILGL